MFRVQTISSKDYSFLHHLETKVNVDKSNKNRHKRIQSFSNLPKVKLHIDKLGDIREVEVYDF